MANDDHHREALIARAQAAKAILAAGGYSIQGRTIDLQHAFAASRAGTLLTVPQDWDGILAKAAGQCGRAAPAAVTVTAESTLAALERLTGLGLPAVAALNFASARRLGGGWETGARAQEETLARASGLTLCLAAAPGYYQANRQHEHLFYTDHAIWSPEVPFFARDDGALLPAPYAAGIITMPAPNPGGMIMLSEADLRALRGVWLRRIRMVLALAIVQRVRHLVLGAWGCGAFGNDPLVVAGSFREVLDPAQPWVHGFDQLVFAIMDQSRQRSCLAAFTAALQPMEIRP